MRLVALALLVCVPVTAAKAEPGAIAPSSNQGRIVSDAGLEPAKATYRVSLFAPTAAYVSASGTFTDQSVLACNGWNVEQRLYVEFMPVSRAGLPVSPDRFRSGTNLFESADGLTYRFEDKSSMRGQTVSAHKGVATLTAPGQGGKAVYEIPANQQVAIPPATLFPTHFGDALVRAAGAGMATYSGNVFDGSMGVENGTLKMMADVGIPRASTFKDLTLPQQNSEERDFMTALAWPVRLIVKPLNSPEAKPLLTQGFSLLPNGRAELMVMDFGVFKLQFNLVKYEPQPKPECH